MQASASAVQPPPPPTQKHIPRPPNAFILFRAATQSQLELSSKPQARRSVDIAELWRRLDEEERSSWYRKAENAKIEHAKAYPGWKYQPGKKAAGSNKRPGKGKGKGEKMKGTVLGGYCRCLADVTHDQSHVKPHVGVGPSTRLDERFSGGTGGSEIGVGVGMESRRNNQCLYYHPELEATNPGPWSFSLPLHSNPREAQLPFQLPVERLGPPPIPNSTPDFDFYHSFQSNYNTGSQSSSAANVGLDTQAQFHAQTSILDPSDVVLGFGVANRDMGLDYEVSWGTLDWLKFVDQALWSDEERDFVRRTFRRPAGYDYDAESNYMQMDGLNDFLYFNTCA
ncbi:hypothetical protein E1B28_005274 [Marasmius oreades]|uniref:HMG box domain-containing protein n=1 Tax=Marasmius oreades TaxID=181124 RepID=A0A9P8ADY9_9AGAR|nr:uncharacterized protein E1B28_005274 [Marasmius oreades]KAG7097963.1 hypothetical protein E1B28_005274 [Marasmius oreades]